MVMHDHGKAATSPANPIKFSPCVSSCLPRFFQSSSQACQCFSMCLAKVINILSRTLPSLSRLFLVSCNARQYFFMTFDKYLKNSSCTCLGRKLAVMFLYWLMRLKFSFLSLTFGLKARKRQNNQKKIKKRITASLKQLFMHLHFSGN